SATCSASVTSTSIGPSSSASADGPEVAGAEVAGPEADVSSPDDGAAAVDASPETASATRRIGAVAVALPRPTTASRVWTPCSTVLGTRSARGRRCSRARGVWMILLAREVTDMGVLLSFDCRTAVQPDIRYCLPVAGPGSPVVTNLDG